MTTRKQLFWATTALMSGVLMAGAASAQSTASQAVEERASQVGDVVVTGVRGPRNINGAIVAEQVGKSRSTITQEYLSTQAAGQTVLQSLNLQPGVNFTNTDAYGNSGGDITIRGFDAQRISLNLDGVQLNDSGNYQIYSNQQLEPELVERASVNQGTTDVDSPTASATGGTINMTTRRPAKEFGAIVQPSVGGENYQRIFGLIDTGEVGPWGTTAWFAASATTYDQYGDNPGELKKHTYNGRIYQPLGDNGDFLSLAGSYVRNRNNTYGNKNVDRFNAGTIDAGNTSTCLFDPAVNGTVQDQGSSAGGANPGCGNYYNYFQNPSNTFSLRGQSRFTLTDKLTLTVDPTYQYTLANGGGTQNIWENDQRLQGSKFDPLNPNANGVDLNGDGDTMDRIKLYSPSNTNTNRYSVNTSLIYALTDNHRLRLSYTFDTANHRQTGEYGLLRQNGDPVNPFGGYKNGGADPILTLDGTPFQKRDRRSRAELSQFAVQYIGNLFNDAVTLDVGLRAPRFSRDLQNYCYQINTFDAYCSAQTPTGSNASAGAPVKFSRKYDDILPNVGATWRFAPNQQIFASYSETLSAPRTDDLYDRIPATPEPETATNIDLGYRYQSGRLIASGSVYLSKFENYIARAITDVLNPDGTPTGETIVTNINAGDVDRWGADGQIGYMFTDNFSLYASASYLGSEVKEDIPNDPAPYKTGGKELFEVPEWQYALRAEYKRGPFTIGVQGKYVDERWTNLINDEQTPAYTVVDLDARYDLDFINEGMYFQVNVMNLFDEEYLGNISTDISGNRSAALGSPRTAMATLRLTF